VIGVLEKREQFGGGGGNNDQNNTMHIPYNVAKN
jgi:hypothetical protein